MRLSFVCSVVMGLALTGAAHAQISVKLGVLNDRSGVYSDLTGEGSVVAARMAVEDFKAAEKGIKVDIVAADHQNKPDIGASGAGHLASDLERVQAIEGRQQVISENEIPTFVTYGPGELIGGHHPLDRYGKPGID